MFPEVARSLFVRKAFPFGEFKLKHHEKNPGAPPSPYKADFRLRPDGPLDQQDVQSLGSLIWLATYCGCDLKFDAVVGVPKAGDALAAVVARILRVPQGFLAKEERRGKSEIVSRPGERLLEGVVLLIDDVVTEAESKLEAVRAIRHRKGLVWHIGLALDREEGGVEVMARDGVTVHAVWRASELYRFFLDDQLIEQPDYDRVARYIDSRKKYRDEG
ncbi:MAG: hypothetical protein HYT42_01665 [Candidatus Sungbacteria bacterium]|nr:hypothetical protein [Candidatus Sungbacteria bacterium]